MTAFQMNKDNQYKIHIFIVLLFVLIIVLTSGLAYPQTKSELTNWLRKYVYLYELPNTSPKQVLLKIQSDFTWHSLLLTEKGNYWYQLSPDSEQQFPAFAQAMLGVKVEYNEIPTNIKTENRIWAFREAINAPKGSGPFGSLTMGYFVEKFQRAPFSTLIVDNISLELINITKILEMKDPSPDNKKLLASFGLEKANVTVSDFERMRQNKTLIKGEPAFQNAYFQQIQSWQTITKSTKPGTDITSANNMRVTPMIVGFFIIIIILGFLGWFIIYHQTRSAIKHVTQNLSELRGELGEDSQTSIPWDNILSKLKADVAEIITVNNEKISRLGENIADIAEQLKENQDTTAKLYQVMFAIQEQAKQFEAKLTKASNISAIAQQWEEFKSKFRPLISALEPIADVINQLRNFVDEGVLEQLEQLAPKLPLFYRENAITEEEEISQSLKYIELPEYMQESFIDFAEEYYIAAIEEKFSAEHDSIVDAINQLRSFVDTGVLTRLEQLAPKLQEAETIVQRPKNIDKTDKMTIEPNGAIHSDIKSLELDINI